VLTAIRHLPGARPSTQPLGADLAGRAKGYYRVLDQSERRDVTIAVSEVTIGKRSVEVVTINGEVEKATADKIKAAAEQRGGVFDQAPGRDHAETFLYETYKDAEGFTAIGVSNYKGSCPKCSAFFRRIQFNDVYWDDTFVP
jgi:hypothetical protein